MIRVHLADGCPSGFAGKLDFEKGVTWEFMDDTFSIESDEKVLAEIASTYVFFVERVEEGEDA